MKFIPTLLSSVQAVMATQLARGDWGVHSGKDVTFPLTLLDNFDGYRVMYNSFMHGANSSFRDGHIGIESRGEHNGQRMLAFFDLDAAIVKTVQLPPRCTLVDSSVRCEREIDPAQLHRPYQLVMRDAGNQTWNGEFVDIVAGVRTVVGSLPVAADALLEGGGGVTVDYPKPDSVMKDTCKYPRTEMVLGTPTSTKTERGMFEIWGGYETECPGGNPGFSRNQTSLGWTIKLGSVRRG